MRISRVVSTGTLRGISGCRPQVGSPSKIRFRIAEDFADPRIAGDGSPCDKSHGIDTQCIDIAEGSGENRRQSDRGRTVGVGGHRPVYGTASGGAVAGSVRSASRGGVAGVAGSSLRIHHDHASKPAAPSETAAVPVSESSQLDSAPTATGKAGGESGNRSRPSHRSQADQSTSETSTPEASSSSSAGAAVSASPSQAADAFSPPVGGGQTSSGSSGGSSSSTASSQGSSSEASAAQAASAFGPLP